MTDSTPVNLLNFDRQALTSWCKAHGEPGFRAQQLIKWMHQEGCTDFNSMTNLSKALRAKLSEIATIQAPMIHLEQESQDGTCKWVLAMPDGNKIETVFIPEGKRGTLCVSSQVGCSLNCSFCSTARQGFNRNLTVAEIIGQVWVAVHRLKQRDDDLPNRVTNVVMMGMGEPLLNFDPVVSAMDLMMDDLAYGLSKRRVTLSTSGVVPAMEKLKKVSDVALAVSLHAPNDELRNQLVPINKKYPLKQLMQTCREYFKDQPRRVVTMEYVMLDHVNDSLEHAAELAKLLKGVPCKMNLIPFNPFPNTPYKTSSNNRIKAFQDYLIQKGFNTIVRKTRGDDIDAACGQLVGKVNDKTRRSKQWDKLYQARMQQHLGEVREQT